MKQFIRYLSLIACVVVVGVWVWSYFRFTEIGYSGKSNGFLYHWDIVLNRGFLWISAPYASLNNSMHGFIYQSFDQTSQGWGGPSKYDWIRLPGLIIEYHPPAPQYGIPEEYDFTISCWLLFTPLFLITLKLWYHPIKAWWRETSRLGFEVETKNKSGKN